MAENEATRSGPVYRFKTDDDPAANARQPNPGDVRFTVWFPLDGGGKLYVDMGPKGLENLAHVIDQARADPTNA